MTNSSDPDTESFTKSYKGQCPPLAWQVRHNSALPVVCKQVGTLVTQNSGWSHVLSGSEPPSAAFFLSPSPHTTYAPHLNSGWLQPSTGRPDKHQEVTSYLGLLSASAWLQGLDGDRAQARSRQQGQEVGISGVEPVGAEAGDREDSSSHGGSSSLVPEGC